MNGTVPEIIVKKIYPTIPQTKTARAGDVEIVEYGKPKVDIGFPVFNYAVGYDVNNRNPYSMKNIRVVL